MIAVDLSGSVALVTGGTRGLGRAVGLALGRAGAHVVLTHRWGTTPDEEVLGAFTAAGLAPPTLVESDAGDPDEVRELMGTIHALGLPLRVIVSNVAMAKVVRELGDLKKNSLDLSIGYSAWPLVDLLQASESVLGTLPRYAIGISSDGTRYCHEGYDMVGASKSVLETLARYLAVRLKSRGVRVNIVQPGALDTDSATQTFGEEAMASVRERVGDVWIKPERVADVIVGMCSGLMDAITGQVIVVDEGWSLISPLDFVHGRSTPFAFPEDA